MSGGWAGPPSPAPQWVQRGAAPGRGGRSLPAELRLGGGGGGSARGRGRGAAQPPPPTGRPLPQLLPPSRPPHGFAVGFLPPSF